MQKRALVTLALPLGLVACQNAPTSPGASASPVLASDAAPVNHLAALPEGRLQDLGVVLADARARILPALAAEDGGLAAAFQRLGEALAAEDGAAVIAALADADAALSVLPAEQADALSAELDAMRLAFGELRTSAEGRAVIE